MSCSPTHISLYSSSETNLELLAFLLECIQCGALLGSCNKAAVLNLRNDLVVQQIDGLLIVIGMLLLRLGKQPPTQQQMALWARHIFVVVEFAF